MPRVADDDSKAVRRIAEIEQELQERKAELDEWLTELEPLSNAAAVAQRERATKALTDRIQALAMALDLQRSLAGAKLHAQERQLGRSCQRRRKISAIGR